MKRLPLPAFTTFTSTAGRVGAIGPATVAFGTVSAKLPVVARFIAPVESLHAPASISTR